MNKPFDGKEKTLPDAGWSPQDGCRGMLDHLPLLGEDLQLLVDGLPRPLLP